MKLSDAQRHTLAEVFNDPMTETDAMIFIGRGWRATTRALQSKGLIRFHPHARKGEGAFKVTAEGRAEVAAMLTDGRLVKE